MNKSVTRAPSLPPTDRLTLAARPVSQSVRRPAGTPNERSRPGQTDSKIPAAPSMGLTNPEPYAAVAPLGPAARTSHSARSRMRGADSLAVGLQLR
jgi:hypothetical protein